MSLYLLGGWGTSAERRAVGYALHALAFIAAVFVLATLVCAIPMTLTVRFYIAIFLTIGLVVFVLFAIASLRPVRLNELQRQIPVLHCVPPGKENFARSKVKPDRRFKNTLDAQIIRVTSYHWVALVAPMVGWLALCSLAFVLTVFVPHVHIALPQNAWAKQHPHPKPQWPVHGTWHAPLTSLWHDTWWVPWLILSVAYLGVYYLVVKWQSFTFIVTNRQNLVVEHYSGPMFWKRDKFKAMGATKADENNYEQGILGKYLDYGTLILDAPNEGVIRLHPIPEIEQAQADTLNAAQIAPLEGQT